MGEREMIKPIELETTGYQKHLWNAGIITEYWKPLSPRDGWNYRLAVRFGEHRDKPFTVWLITGPAMTQLPQIDTINKLNQLYRYLNWVSGR